MHERFSAVKRRGSVRAGSLDVTWLLALVADALVAGLGWAVTAEMTDFTAWDIIVSNRRRQTEEKDSQL